MDLLHFRQLLLDLPARIEHRLLTARALQIAAERVVIRLADRIKLVIVASRAGDRQAKKRLAENVDLIVQPIALMLADIDRRVRLLAEKPEPGGDD